MEEERKIYVVTNGYGYYVGQPCLSYEEALELANQDEMREIYVAYEIKF